MTDAYENENLPQEGQPVDNVGQDENQTQNEGTSTDWESQAKYFQSEKDKLHAENQKLKQYEQIGITWYTDGKPVFKLVKELIDGELYIIPGRCPIPDTTIHLCLTVGATSWEAAYKTKEEDDFIIADQGELPSMGRDHISLQCYNGPENEEHWVRFENFRVTQCN